MGLRLNPFLISFNRDTSRVTSPALSPPATSLARLVHTATAVNCQVQGDIHIPNSLRLANDPPRVARPRRQILGHHLQAGDRVVVAHADWTSPSPRRERSASSSTRSFASGDRLAIHAPRGRPAYGGLVPSFAGRGRCASARISGFCPGQLRLAGCAPVLGRRAVAWPCCADNRRPSRHTTRSPRAALGGEIGLISVNIAVHILFFAEYQRNPKAFAL